MTNANDKPAHHYQVRARGLNNCPADGTESISQHLYQARIALAAHTSETSLEQWYLYIWHLTALFGNPSARANVRRETLVRCWYALSESAATPHQPELFVAGVFALVQADYNSRSTMVAQGAPWTGQAFGLLEQVAVQAQQPPEELAACWRAWRYLPGGLQDCLVCRWFLGLSEAETVLLLGLDTVSIVDRTWQALAALASSSAGLSHPGGSALDEAFGLKSIDQSPAKNGMDRTTHYAASKYIDALNSGQELPLREFLADFPVLDPAARRRLEQVLYFLYSSAPPLQQLREHLVASLLHAAVAVEARTDFVHDRIKDWMALQDRISIVPGAGVALLVSARPAHNTEKWTRTGLEPTSAGFAASGVGRVTTTAAIYWQVQHARQLLQQGYTVEVLEFLDLMAEDVNVDVLGDAAGRMHSVISYLYGAAYLGMNQPLRAEAALLDAMSWLQPQSEDEIRVRDLLGAALTAAERPDEGYREHKKAFEAVLSGVVTDSNLVISIFVNMADDLLALNEPSQAINLYNMALEELQASAEPAALCAIYRRLGVAYTAAGAYPRAMLQFWLARRILLTGGDATMSLAALLEMAECKIAQGCLADARSLLLEAQSAATKVAPPILGCRMYRALTELALKEGDLDQAARWSAISIDMARRICIGSDGLLNRSSGHAISIWVSTLGVAAKLAEQQAGPAIADDLFKQSLELIEPTSLLDQKARLARDYADVLQARGTFEDAVVYYRRALCCRLRNLG